jgi:Tol biopolymer transport system component
MYIVAADGGTPNLLRPDALDNFSTADAAWKPGSRQVSLWGRGRGQDWMFVTIPVDSGPAITSLRQGNVDRQLRDANLTLGRFVWSRSGRNLFFEGVSERVRNLWRVTIDPSTLAWVAGPDRLTTGAGPDADVALSPDGTRLVFSTRQSLTRLWAFPFDAVTGQVKGIGEPVTSGGAGEQDADAPLDGNKLVYTAMRGNRQEIWEKSTVDQSERLLISTAGWNRTRPRWSPDGSSLAYMRTRSDAAGERAEPAVAVLPIGGNERLLTRPGEVRLVPTDWSPDGRWLLGACQSGAGRGVGTCVLPVSTEVQSAARVRVVASDPARNLFESRFSPNQQWVCFVAVDTADARASRIYVVPIGGGPWRPVTEGAWYDDKPHWSRDGKTLYFVSNRQGFFNVWGRRFDPASGTPSGDTFQVTNFTSSRQTISPELSRMQIAVTARHLFLPITETSGELWALDNIDR